MRLQPKASNDANEFEHVSPLRPTSTLDVRENYEPVGDLNRNHEESSMWCVEHFTTKSSAAYFATHLQLSVISARKPECMLST